MVIHSILGKKKCSCYEESYTGVWMSRFAKELDAMLLSHNKHLFGSISCLLQRLLT